MVIRAGNPDARRMGGELDIARFILCNLSGHTLLHFLADCLLLKVFLLFLLALCFCTSGKGFANGISDQIADSLLVKFLFLSHSILLRFYKLHFFLWGD